MFKKILIFSFCVTLFASPEDNIIIIDDFISDKTSSMLISHYKQEVKSFKRGSHNSLHFTRSTPPKIKNIARWISNKILDEIEKNFGVSKTMFHVSHGGLYGRIAGNFCPYHSDNIAYVCPIHGKDARVIRKECSENCMGSFQPNHTFWYDYSAILYLNEDFEGGEIVLEDGPFNKIYRKKVPIKKNRLVLFPNGPDYYHEVLQIKEGIRHALIFWYTNDPNHTDPTIN